MPLVLVDEEDMKIGMRRKSVKGINKDKGKSGVNVLTKKSSKEKEDLTEKLGLKGKKTIEVKKTIRIPVHYDVTKNKMDILNRLTARITYGIRLISEVVYDLVKDVEHSKVLSEGTDEELQFLKLNVIEEIVKNSDIEEKTGLQSTYIQQCINKVIFSYKSYRDLHKKWEVKVERAEERLEGSRDDKERMRGEKWLEKLIKREPSKPDFRDKTPCRLDWRTGNVVRWDEGKLSKLWIKISTLDKGKTICIPLSPSQYHINQLKDVVIDDFEIIKGGDSRKKKNKNKYYIHVSITKVVERKKISSVGGIDQGLNKSIAAVLIGLDDKDLTFPREEQLLDSAKVELLEKYDDIVASLQEAEKWDKLRQLRNKRENVSIYHDWCLANKVAEFTEGSYVAIGNSQFRQGMFRGNQMPGLRKRIGKWSYSRQRKFIRLKRAERGYDTELRDEYGTSRECCKCHSKLTTRKYEEGYSYILCHSCEVKIDADLNAGNVIATQCRDDMLKAGMIRMENPVSR
jgi:hypothetical protein